MEYIYSAMLLHSAGQKITEANIKKVLEAAGIKPDAGRIKALAASLDGVNIEDTLKNAAPVAAAPAAGGAPPAAASEASAEGASEEKKEEKKKKKEEPEVSEEEAAAGLGALFG